MKKWLFLGICGFLILSFLCGYEFGKNKEAKIWRIEKFGMIHSLKPYYVFLADEKIFNALEWCVKNKRIFNVELQFIIKKNARGG